MRHNTLILGIVIAHFALFIVVLAGARKKLDEIETRLGRFGFRL